MRKKRSGAWRIGAVVCLWGLVLLGLCARLGFLYKNRDFLQLMSNARVVREKVLRPLRAPIRAEDDVVLAKSQPYWSLAINPIEWFKHPRSAEKTLKSLASAFDVSASDVRNIVNKKKDKSFVWVKRLVTSAHQMPAVRAPGVLWLLDYKRMYYGQDGLEVLLGKTDVDGKGIEGLEQALERDLKGCEGRERLLVGPSGEVIESVQIKEKKDADATVLTLNVCLQHHTYQALKKAVQTFGAKRAAAVVVSVNDAAVRAAAHYEQDDAQASPWGLTESLEPGSMFKPIVMAYMLEKGYASPKQIVDTGNGRMKLGKHEITDVHAYGKITSENVIAKSSNIGMAKLFLATPGDFSAWIKDQWSVLAKSGLEFPGEPKARIIAKPSRFEKATISFGYGVTMSMMQLAKAYLTIANGGYDHTLCWRHCASRDKAVKRVLGADTVHALVQMLVKASHGHGTGYRAQVKGVRVAGKTGTLHKVKQGVYTNDYLAGYAGFFPANQPNYVVVVYVDEPDAKQHFGGQVAAPVFSEIAFAAHYMCKQASQ